MIIRWHQKATTNLTNQETRERGNHQLVNIGSACCAHARTSLWIEIAD